MLENDLEDAAPASRRRKKSTSESGTKTTYKLVMKCKYFRYGQKGTLLEKISETEWIVQIGILKMNIKESGLEYVKPEKEKQPVVTASIRGRDHMLNSNLIYAGNVMKMLFIRTEKYIDDAFFQIIIKCQLFTEKERVHLRQGVQQYLKNHSRVKNYRFGEAGEGGHGVTVVELK